MDTTIDSFHMSVRIKNFAGIIWAWLIMIHMNSQSISQIEKDRILLPNGWSITPVGKSLPLGDLPLNIAVSSSEKLIAVTNNGQSDQSVFLVDAVNDRILDTIEIGKSWLGLAFARDDHSLFASGGNDNWIIKFDIAGKKLKPGDTIRLGKPWPEKISPAGLAYDDHKKRMYVVTRGNNSLYIIDVPHKNVIKRFDLGGEGYTCILSENHKILYISCWGCDRVLMFDIPAQHFKASVSVGSHPNDMCLSKEGKYLFVANANDNTISVIDLRKNEVIEVLDAALYPDSPSGSTTNSVSLSKDDKTLYIANADNNCLAVFDVSQPGNSRSRGVVPAGWYPTCVRIAKGKIFIANGKGFTSRANPFGPDPAHKQRHQKKPEQEKPLKVQYIAGLFRGTLSIIAEPGQAQLGIYSQVVYRNNPYNKEQEKIATGIPGNPVPMKVGDTSPVKYIFYIIKENRTYDQVLGDLLQGNHDTSLVLFGRKITPNQHKLTADFVLLDNFYVDGEVSADGHNWSMGAYATDYLEKTWPTAYGGRGGSYDAEGILKIASNKNGFIWDLCKRYGASFRTYGEFADDYKPNIPVLRDHYCPYYTSWDQSVYDTTRFYQWKRDFDSLVVIHKVPQLNTLRFINDHTQGLKAGALTPFAQVADNDRAVGLFVQYLSHSPIWKESVVFILEDDAQDGPDHVDAHRSTAYIAGGFIKRGFVDHTMYSTSSVLRTIELILGLPPMSQYDAAATPMWRCFNDTSDSSGFTAIGPFTDLIEKNTALNEWQQKSEEFDFSKEDRAPDEIFNHVLWFSVKGPLTPCPPPRRSAFLKVHEDQD